MTIASQFRQEPPCYARRDQRELAIGVICALLVIALFSGFNIVSRVGSNAGLGLWDIAALRFAVGGLIMLPFFLRNRLKGMSFGGVLAISFLGGLGFALLAYAGFFLAPAAHGAVLLHGTLPFFTFIISLMFGDAVRRRAVPGMLLILFGIGVMAFDSMLGATTRQLVGDVSLLLASACWSTCGILIKRAGVSSVQASAAVVVVSACIYLPLYLAVFGIGGLLSADPADILVQGIFQGVFIGALSIFVYTRSVQSLGPNGTALFTAAIPCVTTLAAIPLLAEDPSLTEWAGVGIVTLGMIAAFTDRLRHKG